MIIAHGPLGYLVSYLLRQRWTFKRWYYWFGVLGGLFPDIDLFYFYLVDATRSHHQFITHSLLPYGIIWLIGWLIKPIRLPVTLFVLGSISHVLADVATGYVAIFLPLSDRLIGVPTWPSEVVELVIILVTVFTLLKSKRWKIVSFITAVVLLLIAGWVQQHSFKPAGSFYYADNDQDGIVNSEDRDLDGDGLANMIDTDINNDGEDNSVDMYLELFSAEGALFDYSFGQLIEVPLRLGLVNDKVLVQRLFSNVGLFIGQEMVNDYTTTPAGYRFDPTDNKFTESADNLLTWLQHTDRLLPADAPRQEFDIVFFQSGQVAIFTRVNEEDVILDVHPSHLFADYRLLTDVAQREGGIRAIGRILPKPHSKRY